MNYQKIHDSLIKRATIRIIYDDNYYETHHILPKCMGGNNIITNLVKLTPEEHYIIHQLLVKIYPKNKKLILACKMMTISSIGQIRNNKMYGWIRRKYSEYLRSKPMAEETKRKISNSLKGIPCPSRGRKRSQKNKDIISILFKGRPSPMKGKKHNEESKRKISISNMNRESWNKGIPHTKETKEKISKALTGKQVSDSFRRKQSIIHKGKTISNEHKKILSNLYKGKPKLKHSVEKTAKWMTNSIWIYNPITCNNKRISKNDINNWISKGWCLGRCKFKGE